MAIPDERKSKQTGRLAKQRPALPIQLQATADGFRQIVEYLPIPLG